MAQVLRRLAPLGTELRGLAASGSDGKKSGTSRDALLLTEFVRAEALGVPVQRSERGPQPSKQDGCRVVSERPRAETLLLDFLVHRCVEGVQTSYAGDVRLLSKTTLATTPSRPGVAWPARRAGTVTMSGAPAAAPPPTAVLCLLDTDDEDDVVVVSVERGAVAPAAPLALHWGDEDVLEVGGGDECGDVLLVGVVGTAPVLPHGREHCRQHVFFAQNTDAAHAQNLTKCDNFFCFVCDGEASQCREWESHCMATSELQAWRNFRATNVAAGKVNRVPPELLPPTLRAAAVRAHWREHCSLHVFMVENTDVAQERNVRTCDKCHCYLCNVEALLCPAWDSHCMASETEAVWQNLRKQAVQPGEAVAVPSLLLPPKLLHARRASRLAAKRTGFGQWY